MIVGGAIPPSSTGGSRPAPSPSHYTHPPSSAVEPPPPSSLTNRVPEPMRRPYAPRGDRYPNLEAALQRIGDLEDENYTLRYELDRARAAPLSSSSTVVSAAAVDSVLSAFSLYERESTHLEARSREARENYARALLGLVGHSRGRDRDVLSSAMIPAGERDWRNSPTDVSRLMKFIDIEIDAESVPVTVQTFIASPPWPPKGSIKSRLRSSPRRARASPAAVLE